ncbi:hypothetical protein [Zavarzinella formosa]|uniref:hypothetical protein n=1 Tax=Zavarzinella formosa TaxID=360055 RepID=UPI0002D5B09A|nr:hypothetical protein [Zavarzinella formosa]
MLPAGLAPSWVLPRARYDLDFVNNRYWGGNVSMASANGTGQPPKSLVVTGNAGGAAGSYFAPDTDGVWKSFPQSGIRRTGFGAFVEGFGACANYALWCRDLTNAAWTATNVTTAKTQAGADGKASSATLVTATANNATILQSVAFPAQSLQTAAIAGGGSPTYAVNDLLTVAGGTFTTAAVLKVTSVSGGLPATISIQTPGSYTALPSNPVSVTGGGGSGATFNLNFMSYAPSFVLRRASGSGPVYMTVDGSAYVDITSQISGSFGQVTIPASVRLTPATFGLKLGTSGDSLVVDFAQLENNLFATSPILTTTASMTRGPEYLAFNLPGSPAGSAVNDGYRLLKDITFGTPVTVMIQYSGNFDTLRNHLIFGDDVSNIFVSGAAGGGVVTVSGWSKGAANSATAGYASADSVVTGINTLNKVIVRWDGSGSSVCVNGGAITSSSSVAFRPSDIGLTHGGLGNNGSGLIPTNGCTKRATFWREALSDGEMRRLSTVTDNQ